MYKKMMMMISLGIGFSGCTSIGSIKPIPKTVLTTEKKPEQEPPKKKPEEKWRCKISNGAGRIFHKTDESRDTAEAKARHDCEIYSRHCILLDCNSTLEEDE